MRMEFPTKLLAVSVVFSLSACATDSEARKTLPDYALPLDMGWLVNCPIETVSSKYRNLGAFYDEAGVLLSYERFCEVNRTSSRIRR